MAGAEKIGGFFVDLGLVTNQESFAKGVTAIGKVELAAKALFGTALKVGGALFGMATAAGILANAEEKSSRSIGVSVTTLEKWKMACNLAGVSSKELVSNMALLEEKAQRIKLGQMDEGLAQNLGRLRINPMEFASADAEQRIKMVFDAAMKDNDPRAMAEVIKDIMGGGMKDLFLQLLHSDKTLEDLLRKAESQSFFNDTHAQKAEEFAGEFNDLKASLASLKDVFGAELGGPLLPIIQELNKALSENKENILLFIDKIARIGGAIGGGMLGVGMALTGDEEGALSVLQAAAIAGTKEEKRPLKKAQINASNALKVDPAFYDEEGRLKGKVNFSDLQEETKNAVRAAIAAGASKGDYKGWIKDYKNIQDGIIAPGGRVTQVAPDDWVFAARDIGKLASAFMPRNFAPRAGNMQLAVNQTITINGNANAMQVKQAAYNGANSALTEYTNHTSRIIQFMPAT